MTSPLWQIPKTWAWTTMGDIAQIVGGGTPSTTDPENFCMSGSGIAWITPADLSGYKHKQILRGARDITEKGLAGSGARLMPAGTVLFSSRAPIGYVAIAQGAVSTNQGFKSFVLPKSIQADYLYYYLQRARQLAEGLASGTTFKEISGRNAALIPASLAPTNEQLRIVEALDSYLTRLDATADGLGRVGANLKRYRASVLKAAIEGRLVPTEAELAKKESRDYEPASDLLVRVLKERRRSWEEIELATMKSKPKNEEWKSKYQEPAAPDTTDLPELPSGWCWARAEQLSDFITKGTTPRPTDMTRGEGEIPYIKVYNLTFDGALDFSVDPTFVPREVHQGLLARSICKPGDVLMNIVGPPLGKVSIVPGDFDAWNINQAVARYRPVAGIDRRYLSLVLRSDFIARWSQRRAKATAGQFNLTLEISRDLPIPVPPEQEQTRIADEEQRLLSLQKNWEGEVRAAGEHLLRLRQSVLKWAFEGRLVAQDSSDEPASVLLDHIRRDRARTAAESARPVGALTRKTA